MSKTDLNKILHCDFLLNIGRRRKNKNRWRINASPHSGCRIRNVGPESNQDVGKQMIVTDSSTLIIKYKNKWLEEFLRFRRSENDWDILLFTKKEESFGLPWPMLVKRWIRYADCFGGGFAATDDDYDGYDFVDDETTTKIGKVFSISIRVASH